MGNGERPGYRQEASAPQPATVAENSAPAESTVEGAQAASTQGDPTAALAELAKGPRSQVVFTAEERTAASALMTTEIFPRIKMITSGTLSEAEVRQYISELVESGALPIEWARNFEAPIQTAVRQREAGSTEQAIAPQVEHSPWPEATKSEALAKIGALIDAGTTMDQRARQQRAQEILRTLERLTHSITAAATIPMLERHVLPQIQNADIPAGLMAYLLNRIIPTVKQTLAKGWETDIYGIWKWEEAEKYSKTNG